MHDSIQILGVPIQPLTVEQLHQRLYEAIENDQHSLFLHANLHALNLAYENDWLRSLFQQADCVFCDGAGVRLAAWLIGKKIPARITYADWTWQLAEFAEKNEFTLYCLGARPGVAEKAAQVLKTRFPNLKIVGVHHGYFDRTPGSAENNSVIQEINRANPDILLVGFGMPIQEEWLMQNWPVINADVALTGGAVFDYVSGELRRGPRWLTDYGLEWLARLWIEPRRLWKRYLIGNPLFMWRLLRQLLR